MSHSAFPLINVLLNPPLDSPEDGSFHEDNISRENMQSLSPAISWMSMFTFDMFWAQQVSMLDG
jgi:hypothetical protein